MNIKSAISAVNKYMNDIFDMFGGQSKEYMNALKSVRDNIPESVLESTAKQGLNYPADEITEPLKLSVSKNSQNIFANFETDLSQLRSEQKIAGSALSQAQSYIEDLKQMGKSVTYKNIRELSEKNYAFSEKVNDWYKKLTETDELSEEEKSDVLSIYSELNAKGDDPEWYADAQSKIQKYVDIMAKREYETAIQRERELQTSTENNPDLVENAFEINPLEVI